MGVRTSLVRVPLDPDETRARLWGARTGPVRARGGVHGSRQGPP
jgi:hypothetical protein